MDLNSCSPGLAANAAQVMITLVEDYTELSQNYLKQQLSQAQIGKEGVKGSALFTQQSLEATSNSTREDAFGSIEEGSMGIAGTGAGYARGLSLNSDIAANQEKLTNANNALSHLQASVPANKELEPALSEKGQGQQLAANDFENKFVKQNGFNYGQPVQPYDPKKSGAYGETETGLQNPPTEALKQQAIDAANETISNTHSQIEKRQNEQTTFFDRYGTFARSVGSVLRGTAQQRSAAQQSERAQYEAAKTGADYLKDSNAANSNVTTGAFESAKQHVGQVLQNMGSLAEVDNMRA